MNQIDLLLKSFCRHDADLREWMKVPHSFYDYNWATIAYCAIKAPKTLCEGTYEESDKLNYIEQTCIVKLADPVTVPIAAISNVLAKFEKVFDKTVCQECRGSGEYYDDEDELANCFECEGSGNVDDEYAPMVYPSWDHAVKFGNYYVWPYNLGLLETVAVQTGIQEVTLLAAKEGKPLLWQVGELQVLMMGLIMQKEHFETYIIHELNLPELQKA